jgi:hypothetical protein
MEVDKTVMELIGIKPILQILEYNIIVWHIDTLLSSDFVAAAIYGQRLGYLRAVCISGQ